MHPWELDIASLLVHRVLETFLLSYEPGNDVILIGSLEEGDIIPKTLFEKYLERAVQLGCMSNNYRRLQPGQIFELRTGQ